MREDKVVGSVGCKKRSGWHSGVLGFWWEDSTG